MITCKECQERFVDLLCNEVSADDRKMFEEHLAQCADCSSEFTGARSVINVMKRRSLIEPELNNFWLKVHEKIQSDRSADGFSRLLGRIVRPRLNPVWMYGAAAVALVVFGIVIGRMFYSSRAPQQVGPSPATALSGPEARDSLDEQTQLYLSRSKNVLLGLINSGEGNEASVDVVHAQQVSRQLIEQASVLNVALNQPDRQQLRQLVLDLQMILIQLANTETKSGAPIVELVKQGVNSKSIFLKINLEEMKTVVRGSSTERKEKKSPL